MKKDLSFGEIRPLLLGAERFLEENNQLSICRFTEDEQKVYLPKGDFYRKAFSNSNMIISFLTDAEKVVLDYECVSASSRVFSYLDVKVDGVFVIHCGVEDVRETPDQILEIPLSGKNSKVEIFLPPLARINIRSFAITNGTFVKPAPRKKRIISYGDSITQGYDAKSPLSAYTSILAESLQAELINKAIGGDIFNPALLEAAVPGKTPDAVTVAYGTNDWSTQPRETIRSNCEAFFAALKKLYPTSPVFILLPIWRKDLTKKTASGDFFEVREEIRQFAEKYDSFHVIDGWGLVPHVPEFFSDGYLHPNDIGFLHMGQNLVEEIKKILPALQD